MHRVVSTNGSGTANDSTVGGVVEERELLNRLFVRVRVIRDSSATKTARVLSNSTQR